MRRPVTVAQKREVVALSNVVGAVEAAKRLGWSVKAVRGWAADAGYRPQADASIDEMQQLYDLAIAKVTVDVAEGKIKGSALMTVVGVAKDKIDSAARWRAVREPAELEPEPSRTPLTDAASDRLTAFVDSLPDENAEAVRWCIREAIAEPGREPAHPRRSPAEEDEHDAAAIDAFSAAVAAELADGSLRAHKAEHDAIEAARRGQRARAGRWLDDDVADLLIEAEHALEEIA